MIRRNAADYHEDPSLAIQKGLQTGVFDTSRHNNVGMRYCSDCYACDELTMMNDTRGKEVLLMPETPPWLKSALGVSAEAPGP